MNVSDGGCGPRRIGTPPSACIRQGRKRTAPIKPCDPNIAIPRVDLAPPPCPWWRSWLSPLIPKGDTRPVPRYADPAYLNPAPPPNILTGYYHVVFPDLDPVDRENISSGHCPLRPCLKFGLVWLEILRRFLLPTTGCTAVAVVFAKKPEPCDRSIQLVRANELPIYTKEPCPPPPKDGDEPEEDSFLMDTVSCFRKEVWRMVNNVTQVGRTVTDYIDIGVQHTNRTIELLREEENLVQRVGAISASGVVGYVLALRRGMIRKVLYFSTGAGLMAAVLYPDQAADVGYVVGGRAKKVGILAYHFMNGVLGDLTGYQLPALPTGHLQIGKSPDHNPQETVPTTEHLLPPHLEPTHIHASPSK